MHALEKIASEAQYFESWFKEPLKHI